MDCIFCRIIKGEIPCKKVYEDENVFAFRDINPAAPVHVLIVPKKHIEKIHDISKPDSQLIGELFFRAREIAESEGIGEGYRLVVNNGRDAGQTVFHIHVHLLGGRNFTWPPG